MAPEVSSERRRDAGVGLVEIIVAMLLLGLLLAALAPMLVRSLQVSSQMSSRASSAQVVAEQMELLRRETPSCTFLNAFAADTIATDSTLQPRTDLRGRSIEAHRSISSPCATGSTVTIRIWVTPENETEVLAEATTKVWVH